jgi:uncharacterized protein (TIGR02598 family)
MPSRGIFGPRPPARAFSLVEVVIALGIVSFAMLTLVALLPLGLKSEQASSNETSAINLMHAIVTDLSNTPTTNAAGTTTNLTSYRYGIPLPSTYTVTTVKTNSFYVTDNQQTNSAAGQSTFYVACIYYPAITNVTTAPTAPLGINVQVFWPAAGGSTNYQGSVESYVTFPQNLP